MGVSLKGGGLSDKEGGGGGGVHSTWGKYLL